MPLPSWQWCHLYHQVRTVPAHPHVLLSVYAGTGRHGTCPCTMPSMLGIFWLNCKSICLWCLPCSDASSIPSQPLSLACWWPWPLDRAVAIWKPQVRHHPHQWRGLQNRGSHLDKSHLCGLPGAFPHQAALLPLQYPLPLLLPPPGCDEPCLCQHPGQQPYGLIAVIFTRALTPFHPPLLCIHISNSDGHCLRGGPAEGTQHLCFPRLCCFIFYVPLIGVSVIHRFGKHLSPLTMPSWLMLPFFCSPVLNPIVYTMKTKEILEEAHPDICSSQGHCRGLGSASLREEKSSVKAQLWLWKNSCYFFTFSVWFELGRDISLLSEHNFLFLYQIVLLCSI